MIKFPWRSSLKKKRVHRRYRSFCEHFELKSRDVLYIFWTRVKTINEEKKKKVYEHLIRNSVLLIHIIHIYTSLMHRIISQRKIVLRSSRFITFLWKEKEERSGTLGRESAPSLHTYVTHTLINDRPTLFFQ